MGLSSNQARFLSLTSRQVDLEKRVQNICQRRLRLNSELENIATQYNNSISNRKLFVPNTAQNERITLSNLQNAGYQVMDLTNNMLLGKHNLPFKSIDETDMATATAAEIAATGASTNIINLVNTTTGLDFVTHMTTQRQVDGTYTLTPTTSVAISSRSAFEALMDNGFNTNDGLNLNYILMDDIDMAGYSWDAIGDSTNAFTGQFDGNCHTISNITINSTTGYQGMFANLNGTAQNIYLNGTTININAGTSQIISVGTIAGTTGGSGQILNCHSDNISMDLNSSYNPPCVNSNTSTQDIGGITGYVDAGGVVDISTVSGIIDLRDSMGIDQTGGFIGRNASNARISMSGADVDMIVPTSGIFQDCRSLFMGCDYTSGLVIDNCYATGQIYNASMTPISVYPFGHGTGTVVINSFAQNNGTNYYWNGTVTGSNWASSSTTMGPGFASSIAPNGQNIWDMSGGTPVLNLNAISTFIYDGTTPTSDELEEGLRNGNYALLAKPDAYTQEIIKFYGSEYEEKDWRLSPEINDDLYETDNTEAENKYEKIVEEINAQDKKLQLEQTSIEVEYKTISSERESVKKILDQNAQSSFKYFS